jgi:hypothetical protein
VNAAGIREWAAATGIPCPSRGVIPNRVRDAYQAAHDDQADVPAEPVDEDPLPAYWEVTLTIPGGDPDADRPPSRACSWTSSWSRGVPA